jgi:type IV secretion system protein VirB10
MSESPSPPERPKLDPERLALRAPPQPVVRLNRRNLALLAGVVGLVVLFSTLWALQPKKPAKAQSPPEAQRVDRVNKAEGLNTLPRDYGSVARVPALGPPIGELGRPVVRAEQDAGLEPLSTSEVFRPDPREDAVRSARLRHEDEAEAAAKAQVFFQLSQRRENKPTAAPSTSAPLTDPGADRALSLTPRAGSGEEATDPNGQPHKQQFIDRAGDTHIYGSGRLQTPASAYQVMAGTVIPAALLTGINSDLPGQTLATVTENVYDTVTGRYLLIPQGTKLLGQYDSQVAFGQRRVLLVWTRLVMPDGSSILLDRLPGVDTAGYSGLSDQVDSHWGKVFAGAALSTLLGINAQLAVPGRGGNSGSIVVATRDSLQDTVNQVGQQLTRRNLTLQPTLTVRPGFPLRVIANQDLILTPYQQPSDLRSRS